jgi:hypothetical protein
MRPFIFLVLRRFQCKELMLRSAQGLTLCQAAQAWEAASFWQGGLGENALSKTRCAPS